MNANAPEINEDRILRHALRVAGWMFLLFIVLSILHYTVIEVHLIDTDHIEEIFSFVKHHDLLFHAGIAIDLSLFICGIILSVALYTMFKSVNKSLALLALICMGVESVLAVVIELSSYAALLLVNEGLSGFDTEQLQTLLSLVLKIRAAGYGIVILFFNLSFVLFFHLFVKSRYIPKLLAMVGFVLFTFMLSLTFLQIIIAHKSVESLGQNVSVIVMLLQITVGVWLLVKKGSYIARNQ
jgi:hypothetical protein